MATELRDISPAPAPPPPGRTERHRWRHLLGSWVRAWSPGRPMMMGLARSGWLSRGTLTLTFIGMAGSVVATAISYIKG
jgi:hypothetical protein